MKSVLAKQCSAVWRLTVGGAWEAVHIANGVELGTAAQIAELFASICVTQLQPGTTVTARFGEDMIIAAVDDQGVLVSLKQRGGNPIMIKTAMSRLETRSRRNEDGARSGRHMTSNGQPGIAGITSVAAAPTDSQPAQEPRDAVAQTRAPEPAVREIPTLDFESSSAADVSAHHSAVPSESDTGRTSTRGDDLISFEDPSSGEWRATPDTGTLHGQESSVAAPVSGRGNTSGHEPPAESPTDDGLAFEIVFTADDESEEPSVASMESSRFQAGCRWSDVTEFIQEIMQQATEHLGRSVCSNYWRQAIAEYSSLDGKISIGALGRVSVSKSDADVTPREAEALTRAVDTWRDRAARAVGDVDKHVPALKLMPWTTAAHFREEVP